MKILILGHGQHGKDTLATIIAYHYRLTFSSSSMFAFEKAIWPILEPVYDNKEQCYADRRVRRQEWKDLISKYNTPDKARLIKEMLAKHDMYVGLRCADEYAAGEHLFDKVFWIHRPGAPEEASMGIKYDPGTMIPIVNIDGKPEAIKSQVIKFMGQAAA